MAGVDRAGRKFHAEYGYPTSLPTATAALILPLLTRDGEAVATLLAGTSIIDTVCSYGLTSSDGALERIRKVSPIARCRSHYSHESVSRSLSERRALADRARSGDDAHFCCNRIGRMGIAQSTRPRRDRDSLDFVAPRSTRVAAGSWHSE